MYEYRMHEIFVCLLITTISYCFKNRLYIFIHVVVCISAEVRNMANFVYACECVYCMHDTRVYVALPGLM
jgi:hypothetical protein